MSLLARDARRHVLAPLFDTAMAQSPRTEMRAPDALEQLLHDPDARDLQSSVVAGSNQWSTATRALDDEQDRALDQMGRNGTGACYAAGIWWLALQGNLRPQEGEYFDALLNGLESAAGHKIAEFRSLVEQNREVLSSAGDLAAGYSDLEDAPEQALSALREELINEIAP